MNQFVPVYVFLVMATFLWGVQPVIVKTLLTELSPLWITFCRYLGISVILLAILFFSNGKAAVPPARHFRVLALMGITGITLNNVLQFSGLKFSTAMHCSLVSATTPALTAVISAIFLREKISRIQWTGIMISFFGVTFLVAHGSIDAILHLSFNYGDILFLGSQICWAVYSILGRSVMRELSPVTVTAWAGLAGTVATGPLLFWDGGHGVSRMTSTGVLSLLYMVIGGGILAMTWWNSGVKTLGPTKAAIFINIMPLVGMTFAVSFLGEHLGWREILGGLSIISGVCLMTQSDHLSDWFKNLKRVESSVRH
ncbi:DMT family transporter [Acetonema longum]|uniref:Putative transport protein n=1 Tax=Acetonema longum DSM 6540 TaxID=1009370 RepID=F7NKI6_9FIRM|nr:DMT family transporter [Acetonema longum]EGO63438.1 putative transport protein [Acetonema longum DSM 6540]